MMMMNKLFNLEGFWGFEIDVLSNARVLDTSKVDLSKAAVLTKVRVNNAKLKKEFVYTLVSESEANLKEMKISIKSPIGAALLGKSVGDKDILQF